MVGRGWDDVRGACVAAAEKGRRKREWRCAVRLGWVRCGGNGRGQQTLYELGAAVGDEAELGGVVLVLGTKNARDAEEIDVETEGG
jgi:hypothetical protein